MAARTIEVEPFDLVVFGGTGDLAARKLLPALYHRDRAGQIPAEARIVAVSRRAQPGDAYGEFVRQALASHVAADDLEPQARDRFLARISYVALDATGEAGWQQLVEALAGHEGRVRAFYLAVAPDLFVALCERISRFGLITPLSRVVLEKPLGRDGESARAVNEAIGRVFGENQIFRIDHYLGKETVQNLMALRFANALFEPLWNAAHVDHVQITVAEALGVADRAGYYDGSGALRDMVQNHLLQLVCLVAMEPPTSLDADSVRDEKLKVLRALKPLAGADAAGATVRGQYRAGASNGAPAAGYLAELGRDDSRTETFVALRVDIENWRWAGRPFYLRTGKRLAARVSEIVVAFRPIPHSVFDGQAGQIAANRLVIRLQPDEGVKLWLMIKDPGPGGMRLRHVPLDMSFAEAFDVRHPDAYERLLMDVMRGNQTLFMRRDEVEAAWAWIDPILEAWRQSSERPRGYTAGSWGPSAAVALIERDGRTWNEDAG